MGESSDNSGNLNNFKAVEITGKIMVLAIVVLFVIVVAVLFLQLYARCFWWRAMEEDPLHNRRRRHRRSRFVFIPGQDPPLPPRSGLDPAVLRSIPVVVFRPEDFKEALECAVCLCDVAEGERARVLPKCNHGFHVECIDMWFQSHSTCPLCRNPVSSEYNGLNNANGGESGHVESSSGRDEFSESGSNAQASYLPVNVMFWGDAARVSSRNSALDGANRDEPPCFFGEPSSSEEGNRPEREGALGIEIPRQMIEDLRTSKTSGCLKDELKSPVLGRLSSFRRLLSWERRVNPCSSNGAAAVDIERGIENTIQSC